MSDDYTIKIYGKNGDPTDSSGQERKIFYRSPKCDKDRANQRLGNLTANSLRIEAIANASLEICSDVDLKATDGLQLIEVDRAFHAEGSPYLVIYFVALVPCLVCINGAPVRSEGGKQDPKLTPGTINLTVTVVTSGVTGTGTEEEVPAEEG